MPSPPTDLVDYLLSLEVSTLPRFTVPTARQGGEWLRATGGHVTPSYTALTMAQQRWLLDDLFTADREIVHHHVPAAYRR